MMNMSISCDVTECKYNQQNEHYCTLSKIEIIKNNSNKEDYTDCASFEKR